jgi:hypothetical protein
MTTPADGTYCKYTPVLIPSSNDDLLCYGTLEITDRDFGLWRYTMAVSDIFTT